MPKGKGTAQPMESDSNAGPTRMSTRARNATAHPGNVLRGSRVHRNKEEIEEEKKKKKVKKEGKEKRMAEARALKAAGNAFVAQRDMEDIAATAEMEKNFPRHRNATRGMVVLLGSQCLVIGF
jgi:hypothetical protein